MGVTNILLHRTERRNVIFTGKRAGAKPQRTETDMTSGQLKLSMTSGKKKLFEPEI